MHSRIFRSGLEHDAQPERRPRRRRGTEVIEARRRAIRLRLDQVDAQIEGRAACKRYALGDALLAKRARQMRVEPLRLIPSDPWRRAPEVGSLDPRPLIASKRRGRKSCPARQRADRVGRKVTLKPEHAEQNRTRTLLAHDVGA